MTIKMTVDRNAMWDLIKSDPEFEIALKQSVLSEMAIRLFDKHSDKIFQEMSPSLWEDAAKAFKDNRKISVEVENALRKVTKNTHLGYKVPEELQDVVDGAVEDAVRKIVQRSMLDIREERELHIEKSVKDRFSDELIQKRVDHAIDKMVAARVEEIAQDRIDELIQKRLENMMKKD